MKINHVLSLVALILIGFIISTTYTSCANIVPPLGGPKDTLPPVLVNVNPADSTLGFTGKKILLNFNEYIQLENIQKNLIITPTPKINPTIEQRLKTITVTLRDTLEENTTYTIDFGRAIKDLNEGNPYPNYRYIFSTGRTIDSLTLAGKLLVAETGKADSTLVVLLYNKYDDSAIIKDRSRYIARVDSTGNFRFRNLAPGKYAMYALKDDGARRYLSKDQLFAFSDSLVSSESQRKDIMMYAFVAKDTATKKTMSVISLPEDDEKKSKASKILRYRTNLDNNSQDLLSGLDFSFESPLRSYDTSKIILTDTLSKRINGYTFKKDTSNKKISLVYPWPEGKPFKVIIDSTFAEDTSGKKLAKSDTLYFMTKRAEDYGLVRLRFINLPLDRNPVLQFVQGSDIKFSHVFTNNQFNTKLFAPGDYELRILFDDNKNGIWDTGEFFGKNRRQPEKVMAIKRKINVRANWDNELDIEL